MAQTNLPLTEVAPFNPHYDVLILVAALLAGYLYAVQRIGPYKVAEGAAPVTTRQMAWFFGGVAALFVAAWWPIHDLAEESMFTFHMIEHLIIGLVVPPMLLLGTPRWLAEMIGGGPRVLPIVKRLSRPVPASAVSKTLAKTGWVGRPATARLTSWRLELSSDWEQTNFMGWGLTAGSRPITCTHASTGRPNPQRGLTGIPSPYGLGIKGFKKRN